LNRAGVLRLPLGDGVEALRTPYRIDIMQPVYFYIESFDELYATLSGNVEDLIAKARALGEHAPRFDVTGGVDAHIRAC
jgi:phenylalanine-4-hydroxylase